MSSKDWNDDYITIRGKNIPVKVGLAEQSKLNFYIENPRIYSILRSEKADPSQEDIERRLQGMDHVKALIHDIKGNGGLIDPIIVKLGTLEVLEGNSRLAAYRWLFEKDPIKWGKIRCIFLPSDISEDYIFALLGQYHIRGKKDWAPFEQAGFLYRRIENQGAIAGSVGEELGIGRTRVAQLIETYKFMLEHKDSDVRRWSYYEEFIKSNKLKKVREKFPEFDKHFAKTVKSGAIGKAVHVREKLQQLACGTDRVISKFVAGELSFEEACDRVEDSGNSDATFKKLAKFRGWLASAEAQEEILKAPPYLRKKLSFEVSKLTIALARLDKQLTKAH
jgi:hypothetical protein